MPATDGASNVVSRITVPERPNRTPLESIFTPKLCCHFMAMGHVTHDSTIINLYKHRDTRRYLHLDNHGNAYRFTGASTEPITVIDAIQHAFS